MERITLSGYAGSGKSTVGKILQNKLGFEFISVGNFSRDFAMKQYGLTINQFQEKCKIEPELDNLIDEKFRDECNSKSKIIVDYRLGFHFIKYAFHILLEVSDEIAAQRIGMAKRTGEDIDIISIKQRNQEMRSRFIKLYNVDFTDEKNYNLVLNSDRNSPEEIAHLIINAYNNHGCS
jgi:radical S-adenosyl methionine domain-containing protein 2